MKTLDELQKLCDELRRSGAYPFALGNELGQSPWLEYHYSFIHGDDEFSSIVFDNYFEKHRIEGLKFLLDKLSEENVPETRAKIIRMLGATMDREILRNPNIEQPVGLLREVEKTVLCYAKNGAAIERENAVIVLGWIGELAHIELLGELMLHDPYEKVRAWAASSFMQMSATHRMKEEDKEILKRACVPFFLQGLERENDAFAAGVMVESIAIIFQKKFNLSRAALEEIDTEKIEKARRSALRFLSKLNQ